MVQEDITKPTLDQSIRQQRSGDRDIQERNDKGKGKAESTFTDRIQRSANMIKSSIGSSISEATHSTQHSKSSQPSKEHNRLTKTLGETSTNTRSMSSIGQSIRTSPNNQTAESSFQSFQQMPDLTVPGQEPKLPAGRLAVVEQEARDGDDVVRMLEEPAYDSGILENFQPEQIDDFLTKDEKVRLHTALFDQPRQGLPWVTLLDTNHSLMPGFDQQTTQMLFGPVDADLARQQWLGQWRDVLTSYNDEVWGDLGPLASEAQVEVSQLLSDPNPRADKAHKALDRLRLVLAHLRGGD